MLPLLHLFYVISFCLSLLPELLLDSLRKMALESCFRMTTIAQHSKTRACALHIQLQHLPLEKKARLLPCNMSSKPATSLSASSRATRLVCNAKSSTGEVLVVTDTNWSMVVAGNETPLVVVEFWAPWCGPCRMIALTIDELAKEYTGKIKCYKLNTDDCPNITTMYGIRSVPTVLIFKNGEKKESIIGAVPKSTLTATIEKYLLM